MIKSMRSWNDLEAGIEVEDAVDAVVLDGDADARVRVLAEPVVRGESARPHSFRGLQGQHKGHGRNHVNETGPSMHHKRAHRKCEAARAASARKRACAPSAGNREPCAFAGDTARC